MSTTLPKNASHAFAVRLMEHLVVPTFVLNAERKVIIWNKACERLTGLEASEVIGTSNHWQGFYETERCCLADVLVSRQMDEMAHLYTSFTVLGDNMMMLHAENWCVMPRVGKQLYLAVDAGPIFDEEGNLLAVVETLRDITAQKVAQMELEKLALRDGLTGLANRRAFDEALQREWRRAQREQQPIAVLIADIDNFKMYNDTYGHQKGDECLREVAAALRDQFRRPADMIARYGGEEFVAIMPSTDAEGAREVAERARLAVLALEIPHAANGSEERVTLSVGVASMVPTLQTGPEVAVSLADGALYAAKRGGRNRVVCDDASPIELG